MGSVGRAYRAKHELQEPQKPLEKPKGPKEAFFLLVSCDQAYTVELR